MPSAPTVTVITATYNWSSVLRYAIQTALWQTFQDFEYWVVGDCCTDDSEQVAASFGDSRIHWHNLPQNFGSQAGPNNKGLELARGKYIAYLGHDDVWHPDHLAELTRALDKTGADVAYTLCAYIGPPDNPIRHATGALPPLPLDGLYSIAPTSVMHRRDLVERIGPWRDQRTIDKPVDTDFFLRASVAGARFIAVPELTVFKFPSLWTKGSYVKKPSFQQAEYIRRIQTEPDIRYRELVATVQYMIGYHPSAPPSRINPLTQLLTRLKILLRPPGELSETLRRERGLPPRHLARRSIKHLIKRWLGHYSSTAK